MKMSVKQILAAIALVFAVLSAFTPIPILVSVLLLCVAVLLG